MEAHEAPRPEQAILSGSGVGFGRRSSRTSGTRPTIPNEVGASGRLIGFPSSRSALPTFNREHLFREALGSLMNQDYSRNLFEVVVVDDGSADESVLRSRNRSRSGPQSRRCVSFGRRTRIRHREERGVAEASGSLVAFLDDDSARPTGWLSAMIDTAGRYPEQIAMADPIDFGSKAERPAFAATA